jgi:hypothetical protein
LPLLVVHRTEDAADCPDARGLAHLVADQMKRPALEPTAEVLASPRRGLDVQIYRSNQGLTAVILARGKTRQISDKGATCGGLAVALAVSIAVLLDSEPLPPEPEPTLLLPVLTPPAPTFAASPLPDASSPPPAAVEDRNPEAIHVRVSLAAAPIITVGLLQSPAFGITSELEMRFGRFSLAGGFLVLPSQAFAFAPGQVALDLTAGLLRGCATVVGDGAAMRLSFCLEPFGGSMRGSGRGFHHHPALGSGGHERDLPAANMGPAVLGWAGWANGPSSKGVVHGGQCWHGVHRPPRGGRVGHRAPSIDLVMASERLLHSRSGRGS